MKKVIIFLAAVLIVLMGANALFLEKRVEFRAWALNMEAEKAGLVHETIEVNGQQVTLYDNNADAPVLVMLHGFSGSKTNWLRLAQQFGSTYRVIVPDLMGHGENKQDLNASYHIADQVAFVNALMAKLDIKKFHLVGNSMGGAISSLYAARHPDQVLSVTLISPAGVHTQPSQMDEILEQGSNPLIAKTEQDFYRVLEFVMEVKPFIPDAIAKAEAEIAVSRLAINEKIFKDIRSDLTKGLDKEFVNITAPTLIIWGEGDKVISAKNIDEYAALVKNSKKVVLPGIGHLAMVETPEKTAELMRDFIGS
ncbi:MULTISPECIES: alpha/beta fold hydrolase [unclassified Oleiphilus]|nr:MULTISPECIES: alpha/beta hydrolase [unclassified Oleiphilus]KZY65321.1 hypothetical protein A3738_01090 [Oleiphilus sp. HI0066]KZY68459.1 hypothetical protein A3739_01415 [Oleiphilus sp. HI0067]